MYLRYGSYTHSSNEATVLIDRQSLDNEAGQQYAIRHTWRVTGVVQADDTAAVAVAYAALELAYSQNYRDLEFLDDSGNVLHHLRNAGSLTGVKVIQPPSYPQGDGAELSTYRTYTLIASADYPTAGSVNPLRAFSETVQFSGGGPRRAVIECANVLPQEQIISAFTPFRAVQFGSAVGTFSYPVVPPPLFPGKEEVPSFPPGDPQLGSPRLRNGVYTDFPVAWRYSFISATPLVAFPNRWPVG